MSDERLVEEYTLFHGRTTDIFASEMARHGAAGWHFIGGPFIEPESGHLAMAASRRIVVPSNHRLLFNQRIIATPQASGTAERS